MRFRKLNPISVLVIGCAGIIHVLATSQGRNLPKLPFGPSQAGPFGAYYVSLSYTQEWDSAFPVADFPDVVVRFDLYPHRLIFWRGANYIPCWALPDGPWYTNGFFERRGGRRSRTTSMVEPMSDKQCRYSHVRVLETTPARVVVHWRYAPVDLDYNLAYVDPTTGWGDWADEYYTVYPDGVAVRKAILYSSALDDWVEYQESIVINPPGTAPEENIETEAVTLLNLQGEVQTYTWTEKGGPDFTRPPPNPCIQIVHLRSGYQASTVVPAGEVEISPYKGHAPGHRFNFWNHWPVSLSRSDTTVARTNRQPSHTSLSHIKWRPLYETRDSKCWIMLAKFGREDSSEILKLARAWNDPPRLDVEAEDRLEVLGFDAGQRAYVLRWLRPGVPEPVNLLLGGSVRSPIVNPAFVLHDWGQKRVSISVENRLLEEGRQFRQGFVSREGRDTLILWLELTSSHPLRIQLTPKKPESPWP